MMPTGQDSTADTEQLDLRIAASFEEVSAASERLGQLLERAFGEERGALLRLGVVEAMTNVVEHGCAGRDDGELRLKVAPGDEHWTFTLTDNGRSIPAEALAGADGSVFNFDPDATVDLPEGGMGLSLIRMVFDHMDYVASEQGNRLVLTARVA